MVIFPSYLRHTRYERGSAVSCDVDYWATVPVKISRLISNGYSSIRNSSFGYFSQ